MHFLERKCLYFGGYFSAAVMLGSDRQYLLRWCTVNVSTRDCEDGALKGQNHISLSWFLHPNVVAQVT